MFYEINVLEVLANRGQRRHDNKVEMRRQNDKRQKKTNSGGV
ncbi:MAG: hypothetical protein QXH80_04065 [Candidatus Nanoarchaeia archaeon]